MHNQKKKIFFSFPIADHYWLTPSGDHITSSSSNHNIHTNKNNDQTNNLKVHKKRHRQSHIRSNDENGRNQINHRKYQIRLKKTIQFKYLFQLHMNYVTYDDTGQYVCVVSNQIGEARSSIQLKGEFLKILSKKKQF